MNRISKAWDRFWFSPVSLYHASLFRFLTAAVILVYYFFRHLDLSLWFYETGVLNLEGSYEIFEGRFHAPYFWFPTEAWMIQGLHGLMLACLLLLMLGVRPRIMAAASLFLFILFENRNFMIVYGFDKVAACWLFYLMFGGTSSHFSISSWIQKKRSPEWSSDLLTPVGIRLVQIQLAVIYGYSGLEKLRGNSWWSGEAMWNIVSNGYLMPFETSFLAHVPFLIVLGTYLPLLWEVYFPIAIAHPRLRNHWLFFGLAFHFLTAVTMNLLFFSLIMVVSYVVFLKPETRDIQDPVPDNSSTQWKIRV